ncbi:MAG: prepilin-type N-terminal cleavage/methylation domain-containing protein, partial [Halieaceae bacterium]
MRTQKGFSLIEILVVLVIMGLLISVVAPTVL